MPDGRGAPARSWRTRSVLIVSPWLADSEAEGGGRRAYYLGQHLKRLGAEVHFLYCPARCISADAAEMRARRRLALELDGFHFAPPPVDAVELSSHEPADRYWRAPIEGTLRWLFAAVRLDVAIVVSPWLVKAFVFCPDGVYKILDAREGFNALVGDPLLTGSAGEPELGEKRALLAGADALWCKPWRLDDFQALTSAPIRLVGHAEFPAYEPPAPAGLPPRFGLALGASDAEFGTAATFLRAAEERLRETASPVCFALAGSGAEQLRRDYPRIVSANATGADFEEAYDVAVLLGARPLGAKGSLINLLNRGRAIISFGECWDEWPARHRFHRLNDFDEILAACETVCASPRIVGDLEAESLAVAVAAARSANETLEAAAPPPTAAPTRAPEAGFWFVIAAREIRLDSWVFEHVCDAARYASLLFAPSFFIEGPCDRLEGEALERLAAIGRVAISAAVAAALGPPAALRDHFRFEIRNLRSLFEASQIGFWFASPIADLPATIDRLPVTAFVSLPILALTADEPSAFDFCIGLLDRFERVAAFDCAPTPALNALAARGAATYLVSVFSRTQTDVTAPFDGDAQGEIALMAQDLSSPLLALALQTVALATGRRLRLIALQVQGGPASHALDESPQTIPLDLWLGKMREKGRTPALVGTIGWCGAFAAPIEWVRRAGAPVLSLFVPGAPRPTLTPRRAHIANGVMESALALREALVDENLWRVIAQSAASCEDDGERNGWNLIWDELERARTRAQAPPSPVLSAPSTRPIRAEVTISVQGLGAFRFASPGWSEMRGPIEAFGLRPLEVLDPDDLEYMALGPTGRETPWVSAAKICGGRGDGLALAGFAARPTPHMLNRIDVVYEGNFLKSGVVGPLRNGEFCKSIRADDPLTAISIAIFARPAT